MLERTYDKYKSCRVCEYRQARECSLTGETLISYRDYTTAKDKLNRITCCAFETMKYKLTGRGGNYA